MANPKEIATLVVNGLTFEDWETVWVQIRWADAYSYFRFTAAERDPIFDLPGVVPNWTKLQFKPGDRCKILLAGQLAITGYIDTRQVAYDAHSHGVMLIGKSATAGPAKSSVDTVTGSFDGKNILQVAQEVLAPYPDVEVKPVGTLDLTPFEKLQNEKGEKIWDFLERIGRTRSVIMGSDAFGNWLLIGDHTKPVAGSLVEGDNIKSCHCTITHEHAYNELRVDGQKAASDADSGTASSEMTATAPGVPEAPKSKLIIPSEQPVTQAELQTRANHEAKWIIGTKISATIVVQGWLRDGENLWQAGDDVYVNSPMAMLDEVLKIQTVTFTQDDNGGTQTTLDVVDPKTFNDNLGINVGP